MGGHYVYDCDWCGLKDIPETPLEEINSSEDVNYRKRGFVIELKQFKILKEPYCSSGTLKYNFPQSGESLCDGCAEQVRQLKKSIKEKRR